MIAVNHALKNPGLMIKHKDDLKDVEIFGYPWRSVFSKYPYLYREFSDRFDDMHYMNIAYVLGDDPTLFLELKNRISRMCGREISHTVRNSPALVLVLKDYLYKMRGSDIDLWLSGVSPELSLCIKHRNNPDKVEAAYYVLFPHKLNGLDKEEKREMGKRIIELLREEKA